MKFRPGYPQRPATTPSLRERMPYCSECRCDLTFDDGEYVCPDCGSAFNGDEDGPGTLYPDWAGEPYADDPTSTSLESDS